jgi:hypothetical protein
MANPGFGISTLLEAVIVLAARFVLFSVSLSA